MKQIAVIVGEGEHRLHPLLSSTRTMIKKDLTRFVLGLGKVSITKCQNNCGLTRLWHRCDGSQSICHCEHIGRWCSQFRECEACFQQKKISCTEYPSFLISNLWPGRSQSRKLVEWEGMKRQEQRMVFHGSWRCVLLHSHCTCSLRSAAFCVGSGLVELNLK